MITTAANALPVAQRGDGKLIGWVGDETPWELASAFTSSKAIADRPETVERFLRVYRRGARAYHDAFIGADEKPSLGATAPKMLAILAKHTGLDIEAIKSSYPYIDRDARLDVKDVRHQVEWFKSQGMPKQAGGAEAIIDRRVVPRP